MIEQTLTYGLVCINNEWQTVNNANIATTEQEAILLDFETEEARNEYISNNNISIQLPPVAGV